MKENRSHSLYTWAPQSWKIEGVTLPASSSMWTFSSCGCVRRWIRRIMKIICDCAWVKLRVAHTAVQVSSRIPSGFLCAAWGTGLGTQGQMRAQAPARPQAACTVRQRENQYSNTRQELPVTAGISPLSEHTDWVETQTVAREVGRACWGRWWLT